MGGRGAQSYLAKQRVKIIPQRALIWAKSKIGNEKYGMGAANGILPPGTAKCNLFVEHAFNKGNPNESPFHLHHPVPCWLPELVE